MSQKATAGRKLIRRKGSSKLKDGGIAAPVVAPKTALQAVRQEVQELREAVRQMEQQLQQRDEAIRALLDERTQRLEARMTAVEEGAKPSTSSGKAGQGEEAGGHGATVAEPDDEDREKQRLELKLREVKARMERAQATPSPLGEDLCRAANKGRVEDVRRLLDFGVDVNYTTMYGRSALISALQNGVVFYDSALVSLLLQRGASVNAIDVFGWTALHAAASTDPSGLCVSLLLGAGADVNARDTDGATPLHRAAIHHNEWVVRALVAAGAKKTLKCWSGFWKNKTPFDLAESPKIRDLLRP